jgi:hypothetical protein
VNYLRDSLDTVTEAVARFSEAFCCPIHAEISEDGQLQFVAQFEGDAEDYNLRMKSFDSWWIHYCQLPVTFHAVFVGEGTER